VHKRGNDSDKVEDFRQFGLFDYITETPKTGEKGAPDRRAVREIGSGMHPLYILVTHAWKA
jgi:hypothetical protein